MITQRYRLAFRSLLCCGRCQSRDHVLNGDRIGRNEPTGFPDQHGAGRVGDQLPLQQDANAFERRSEAQLAEGIQHVS